jgi:hypothetical protein
VQTAGNCQRVECDGNGGTTSENDAADLPVDNSACTENVCSGSPLAPSNPPLAAGATCSQSGGTVCNGSGDCIPCGVGDAAACPADAGAD